jgi:colanic acid/amylovoran/stewartan biosynthesis glycosyltransferase WcaL/AmsK/CpsK
MSAAPAPFFPPRPGTPLVVVHSVSRWLPRTCTWLYTQVDRLPPDRIESHVACERVEHLDEFPFSRVHAFQEDRVRFLADRAMRRLRLRPHMGGLFRTSRRVRARVLHSHFGNQGWADARVARGLGLAHLVTFYGLDVNFLPRSDPRWLDRYREMFAGVDLVLCEGPHMARAVRVLGCPPEKIRVHHLGVDLSAIPFRPRVRAKGEPLRVYIAATFREKKGIPTALEALGRLQNEVPLQITVLGDAPDDPRSRAEKARILETLARHRLEPRTRFLGYRPHRTFLEEGERHHVYLHPSQTAADGDTEGGAPVSIIEMAASGMPIVGTKHCDIPEVVPPGVAGLLSPEGDAEGIARHLLWLYRNPHLWPEMVQAARRRVETEFNARIQAERLAALYESVLPS